MRVVLSLGLVRGLVGGLVLGLAGMAIAMAIRAAMGLPAWNAEPVAVAGVLVGLVGYLASLGAFTSWARWAVGAPETAKPDHSVPGRPGYPWTRYFGFDPNHKVIGVQYIVTALVVLLAAGVASLLMRLELGAPGQTIVGPGTYNAVMSFHGIAMIAFILILNGGIINYLLPLMIGARDMAFPRLNAFSYWLIPPAVLLLLFALSIGGWDTGWTAYPPLSRLAPLGQSFMFLAVYLVGLSSILGAINFLTTVVKLRAPGMRLLRLPVFVWTAVAVSILAIGITQFIGMAFLMVVLERLFGMGFYDPKSGGTPLLFEHLFWFYSHPAVYIMIFPWWGVASEVIPVFARKPLFAYRWVVRLAIGGVLVLSPIVWVHHLYPAGVEHVLVIPQMFSTELISVPTGFFFLSWMGTLWMGKIRLATPMLFALTFVVIFLVGGLTGIPNAEVPTDLYLHDTYWVVAHFHFTLGATVFGFMTAFYYWFPKVTGRTYSEGLGKLHWGLMTTGFLVTILPMFWLGLMSMRRRVADYDPSLGLDNMQLLATVGGFLVAISMLVFLANLIRSLWRGAAAPANPWGAHTLEWQVASPPPEENFEHTPQVVGPPYPYGMRGVAHSLVVPAGASDDEGKGPGAKEA